MQALRAPSLFDFALLFLVSAIWGSSFIAIAIALEGYPPLAMAGWRVICGMVLVVVFAGLLGTRLPRDARSWRLFIGIGLLNTALPFALIAYGQQQVDSATTAILMATAPFVSLTAGRWLAKDDPIDARRVLGIALGFAGVVVLFSGGLQGGSAMGMLAIMFAAASYALSALMIRHLGDLPALSVAAGSLICSTVIMMPLMLWLYPPWSLHPSSMANQAMAYLIIGPTALGYVLRAHIVQRAGALFMSGVGYLIPLFAVLWTWLFFNILPDTRTWLALALVLGGVVIGRRRN